MAVQFDTSHHAQEGNPLLGGALGENLVSVCWRDSQTLVLNISLWPRYSFAYTNFAKKN